MIIIIDGDSFPNILKPIIHRAIEKYYIKTLVISNKRIYISASLHINYIIVPNGPDEADNRIMEIVKEGDLVITADIPLASQVVTKSAFALSPRGIFWDTENVKEALSMRDFMQSFRESGGITKGVAPFSDKDAHQFANKLNQFILRNSI